MSGNHRILILGGGFAGLYAALELEKELASRTDIEVTLINRENFFLFTPMLHEVAASDLDLTNIVNPARKLLKRVHFVEGEARCIDLENRTVQVAHGFDRHEHNFPFDQLVLALGSTTHFFELPGVEENALTMKSLADAVTLRNRLIALLEEADSECCADVRHPLLTIVVAGAGFAGVETLGSINDFLRNALKFYRNLNDSDLRLMLVHPGDTILPELDASLGKYAEKKLTQRGVEILAHTRVLSYDGESVELSNGMTVPATTLIWTAGTMPNPLLSLLPCERERGRIKVDATMAVPGFPGVWALGDCAVIPDVTTGRLCPPTAQHALREGRTLAHNLLSFRNGEALQPFRFKTLGQLATIGHHVGVANIFGFRFSGFLAWWMWRTIYLSKLPRFEKKLRVALDWTLDLLFSKDLCQFIESERHPRKESKAIEIRSVAAAE